MKMKHIATIALLGASLAGCKKSWLDVNTNPNQLPSSTPDYVFTNALTRMSSGSGNLGVNELGAYWSGQWTQSNSYILAGTYFSYLYTNTDFNYWDGWYDVLKDFDYAEQGATAANQKFLMGPAKVMKAYLFQEIVDCYGNAPYSDALKGVESLAPKFDDQKAIYDNLIKDLDAAIAAIKANPFTGAGSGSDVMFKGNGTRWIQFANTLKMRILMRQSRVSGKESYITGEINKIAASAEGCLTVDAGVNPGWLATSGKLNPIYERWGYNAAGAAQGLARFPRPTAFLIDNLKATNDTLRMRRLAYAAGGENGGNPGVSTKAEVNTNYIGVPFGAKSGFTAPSTSYLGPGLITKNRLTDPFYLMTAAESYFLQAEAKQRWPSVNLPGSAQSYYESGVKASFALTGTTAKYGASAATDLLTGGVDNCDWNASTDKLKAILWQKWVALTNYSGLEGWCLYRQHNYPNTPQSLAAAGTDRPVRLFYPGTELGSNEANVKAQGDINVFTGRLFWDID